MTDSCVIRVVDDHTNLRKFLCIVLEKASYRVRDYESAEAFLADYDPAVPGAVILDIQMEGMSGLELAEKLHALGDPIPIIMLTGHANVPSAVRAMKLGAIDYLTKPVEQAVLLARVKAAVAADAARRERKSATDAIKERMDRLTPREREILQMLVAGQSNKQIAADLNISERTVANHRASLMDKMEAANAADLARIAVTALGE